MRLRIEHASCDFAGRAAATRRLPPPATCFGWSPIHATIVLLQEEERGSSAEEEGSDEEDEDDEEGSDEEGSGSDDSPTVRRRPRKKSRPFVAPPPRALPQRTTRGARMGNVVADEGDEEFWVSRSEGRTAKLQAHYWVVQAARVSWVHFGELPGQEVVSANSLPAAMPAAMPRDGAALAAEWCRGHQQLQCPSRNPTAEPRVLCRGGER